MSSRRELNQICYSPVAKLMRFVAIPHPQVTIFAGFFFWHTHCVRGKPMNKNDVSIHSTYSPSGEIRPDDQSLRNQNRRVESGTLAIAQPYSGENLRAKSWWAITHRASLLALLVLAALTWTQCDFSGRRFQTGNPFLHSRMRRRKRAISIMLRVCICKGGGSQSGATIGQGYSPPHAGLKNWKEKEVLIPLQMRFFFALWSQPRRGKVDQDLLR